MAAAATILEWTPRPRDLAAAESDIEWYHGLSASQLGARASGYEVGANRWDDEAIHRLIVQLFEQRRVQAVRQYYRVSSLLATLSSLHRSQADWIYRACNYPVPLRVAWHCARNAPGVVTLAGAALRTTATRSAFARAHGGKPAETVAQLLEWASDAIRPRVIKCKVRVGDQIVERERQINQQIPRWAAQALTEAQVWRESLLTAYAMASRAQHAAAYML